MRKILLLAAIIAFGMSAPFGVDGESRAQSIQPAWASPQQNQDRGDRQQQVVPLRQVVDMLRGRYGGELISARLEQGAQPFYVIRWRMPNESVQDFRVDAVSGQMR